MKKHIKSICAMVLSLTLLLSMIPPLTSNAEETKDISFSTENPFIKVEDENGIHYIGSTGDIKNNSSEEVQKITSTEDYYKTIQKGNTKPLIKLTPKPPAQADNSNSKYFPTIGNQGALGSCGIWAGVYYQFSYEMNRKRNVQASTENSYSPSWVYNLVNFGYDSGSTHEDVYQLLQTQGAPSLALVPYDDTDLHNWYPQENIWRNAIKSRLDSYYEFEEIGKEDSQITSPDDTDLIPIKTALANGDVLTYSSEIYSWSFTKLKTHPNAPENSKFSGQEVAYAQIGNNGGHRMTLVGYNDNIWTDINNNNQVDAGEMGAFKIANSWGDGWSNKGFTWVAYDALNKVTSVTGGPVDSKERIFENIVRIDVRPYNEGADTYLSFTLNSADRTQMLVYITGERNGTEKKFKFLSGLSYTGDQNKLSFDGTNNANNGTFVFPLDTAHPEVTADNLHEFTWSVEFSDTNADSTPIVVKDVKIVNSASNTIYTPSVSFPITLDGNSKSMNIINSNLNNKIIYYVGYDNPTLHYKKGNSSWTSVKMTENLERHGSMYKYVIENAPENITLYFSDENGNKDTNGGKYFTTNDRLNFYKTKNVRAPLTITDFKFEYEPIDTNQRSFILDNATGGYEPYNYQYTIENLDTGDVKVYDYNYQAEKSHAFYYEGNYRITVEVLDYSGDVASITKEYTVNDLAVEFSNLKVNTSKPLVGNNISFEAITQYESIISYGGMHSKYEFVISDSSGNVCYTTTKRSEKYHLGTKSSTIYLDWIPEKEDTYSIKVSTTDGSKKYAEKTTYFTVNNKMIGDADGDGRVKIKDATAIQQYLASDNDTSKIFTELSDCDGNGMINIKDVTLIQRYIVSYDNTGRIGEIIEYIPPTTVPETTVAPTTVAPTTVPDNTKTIYFKASSNWQIDNAWFAVYSWDGNGNELFTAMAKGADGVYSAKLEKDYENVIFCRMNPISTSCNWSNVWNQTADLKKPSGYNCFTINNGEWTGANGTWSIYN